MLFAVLNLALAMNLVHASEVAESSAVVRPVAARSPSLITVRAAVKRTFPVTFLGGLYGSTPSGSCETTATRNKDGSLTLLMHAQLPLGAGSAGLSTGLTLAPSEYPLKAGWHREETFGDGSKTLTSYDGFVLKVLESTPDSFNATEYAIDPGLIGISRISTKNYTGSKPDQKSENYAVECEPAMG